MNQATKMEQPPEAVYSDSEGRKGSPLVRVFLWAGIAGLSAALAYTVVRKVAGRPPIDPTSHRIQQLIDEANELLRTLDEQKRSS